MTRPRRWVPIAAGILALTLAACGRSAGSAGSTAGNVSPTKGLTATTAAVTATWVRGQVAYQAA